MRLVLTVTPPFVASGTGLSVVTSPGVRITSGPLITPPAVPGGSVWRFLAELGDPSHPPRVIVDEQRRSRHGWPVRLVHVCAATGEHAVLVYYQCLGYSAEVTARITGLAAEAKLPPALLTLLLSGYPDFRADAESIVALREIWEP